MISDFTAAPNIEIAGQLVPQRFGEVATEYAAAWEKAVVIPRPHEGRVRAVGRDRLDLLNRMSTNALNDLAVGEARPTVLTTPVARMVDLLWVLNRGETVLALTSVGRATAVRRWLMGYVFYNDQVKFEDAAAELVPLHIYGPQAPAVVANLLPAAADLPRQRFVEQAGIVALRARPLAGEGFTLLVPPDRLPAVWADAQTAGALPAGEETYQLLRLAAGQPEAGHELTEDYIPLEANLWNAVSFAKGCYIGQEIIARMESRGKLAKRLLGVRLTAPAPLGAEVKAHANGAVLGTITTINLLPDLGLVALAYLRTAQAEAGLAVEAAGVKGVVVDLPFREH